MNNIKYSLIFIVLIICFSCKENNPAQEDDYYKVKVIGYNNDCNEILIEFIDTTSIPDFLKKDKLWTYPRFNALNLPDSYNTRDLILKIKFRETLKSEEHPCTLMGPPYKFIYIISAKSDE